MSCRLGFQVPADVLSLLLGLFSQLFRLQHAPRFSKLSPSPTPGILALRSGSAPGARFNEYANDVRVVTGGLVVVDVARLRAGCAPDGAAAQIAIWRGASRIAAGSPTTAHCDTTDVITATTTPNPYTHSFTRPRTHCQCAIPQITQTRPTQPTTNIDRSQSRARRYAFNVQLEPTRSSTASLRHIVICRWR